MKAERTTSSYILMIGVLSLLVIGSFVAYQVYAAMIKSQITAKQEKAIRSLDGKIEEEVVDELESRRQFGITELRQKLSFGDVALEEEGIVVEEGEPERATTSGEMLESSQEATTTGKVEEENEN